MRVNQYHSGKGRLQFCFHFCSFSFLDYRSMGYDSPLQMLSDMTDAIQIITEPDGAVVARGE